MCCTFQSYFKDLLDFFIPCSGAIPAQELKYTVAWPYEEVIMYNLRCERANVSLEPPTQISGYTSLTSGFSEV